MYNKLFSKIVTSSVWLCPTDHRIVWITFLALMDQDGFCQMASVANLAHTARVDLPAAAAAVKAFESPDPHGTDQDYEGRRIERVPGGWMVLNAAKYRALATAEQNRIATRERVRKHRAAHAVTVIVTGRNESVTPSEADAEATTETDRPLEGELIPARKTGKKPKTLDRAQAVALRGTRLPQPYELTAEMAQIAVAEGVNAGREHQRFCNYWWAQPGAKGVKLDWLATWRNWCMKAADGGHSRTVTTRRSADEIEAQARARGEDPDALDPPQSASPAQGELYGHLLKPAAPRPEYRPDPGAVGLSSMKSDQGPPQLRPGVTGMVRRGG